MGLFGMAPTDGWMRLWLLKAVAERHLFSAPPRHASAPLPTRCPGRRIPAASGAELERRGVGRRAAEDYSSPNGGLDTRQGWERGSSRRCRGCGSAHRRRLKENSPNLRGAIAIHNGRTQSMAIITSPRDVLRACLPLICIVSRDRFAGTIDVCTPTLHQYCPSLH